jgi:hypothetical protein
MKRINLVLIARALPLFILVFGVAAVSAKGGSVSLSLNDEVFWAAETIHFGGTIEATASLTVPSSGPITFINWGDGTVEDDVAFDEGGNFTIIREHLYRTPGQHSVVVIVIMPDGERTSASAVLNVMSAQETIDWLTGNTGSNSEQGQSLINHLEAAQGALDEGQTETAVEALEAYLNELTEYIDAGLVSTAYPSIGVAGDLVNVLLGWDIYD